MRIVLVGIFAIVAVWLGILSFRTKRIHKTEKAKHLSNLILMGALACVANIAMTLAISREATIGGFCTYCITLDWLIYFACHFTMAATEYEPRVHGLSTAYRVLLIIDSVLLFIDPIYNYAIDVQQIIYNGEVVFTPVYGLYYYIHLLLCYIPAFFILYVVLYKLARTARIYWPRYTTILFSFLGIYAWNGIYVLTGIPYDTSVIGYGIGATLLYYFTLNYIPHSLLHNVRDEIINGIGDGIIFIDDDNHCIYASEGLKNFLGEEYTNVEEIPALIEKEMSIPSLMGLPVDEVTSVSLNIATFKHRNPMDFDLLSPASDGYRYVDIQCRDLSDGKGHHVGRFFRLMDHTEEHRKLEEERRRATRDPLTGIYNRENFYHSAALEMSQHPDTRYVLLVSNVKNFKFINDFFGMNVGDDVLKQIAYEVSMQALPGDVYGRLEADHFAMIVPQERFSEEPFLRASSVIRIVEDLSYEVTVFFGVYTIEADDMSSVAAMCDRCLMAIRSVGSNNPQIMRYYDVQMRLNAFWENQIAKELDTGLREEQFKLYVQPQVAVDGSVPGGEVLIRWEHSRDGLLTPYRFVPALERNGSITRLDYYVWERTAQTLQKWKLAGRENYYLSVNISPIDFYFYDIYDIFTGLVREYDINPKNLRLEITETAVIKDSEKTFALLDRLREVGFIIEMDDFGSGYSSLNLLKDLPADALKIDMLFLQKTRHKQRSHQIIESVIRMAKDLELEVITEGVETEEQVHNLKEMGTDFYQGYYFAKPMPLETFEDIYVKN